MTINYLTQSQVHRALLLTLEKLESCRGLANMAHTAGRQDIAADYLLLADKTRQTLEVLAAWLQAFLWAQGKTAYPPDAKRITAEQFNTALATLPAHLKRQAD